MLAPIPGKHFCLNGLTPRGGGRDRDGIVRHIFANEQDSAEKLSVAAPDEAMLSAKGMKAHRDAYCNAIREFHAQGKMARNLARCAPDPTYGLSRARPCLGDGRQGSDYTLISEAR